jgi:hypothetical protein
MEIILERIPQILNTNVLGAIGTVALVMWAMVIYRPKHLFLITRYDAIIMMAPIAIGVTFELVVPFADNFAFSVAYSRFLRLFSYLSAIYVTGRLLGVWEWMGNKVTRRER